MRNRTTWGSPSRRASAPPAVPGYGAEDQDHPAHQPDPDHKKYQKGDTSAWAEDVRKGPYPEGNPPSVPGYDTEDQDHPAHVRHPRVPKEATLDSRLERKAAKCLVLARHLLGKRASVSNVEKQALDLMDLPDRRLEASLQRLGGGFLAMEEDLLMGMGDDEFGMGDEFGMDDEFGIGDEFGMDEDLGLDNFDGGMDEGLMARNRHLAAEVQQLKAALRKANQNDPKGDTLAPEAKSEEAARKEKSASSRKYASLRGRVASFFAENGGGADDFALKADWQGSRAFFASVDTDKDGIITASEMFACMVDPSKEMLKAADDFADEELDLMTACGEMVLAGEMPDFLKKKDDKSDGDDKGDEKDDKGGDKKARKAKSNRRAEKVEEEAEELEDEDADDKASSKKAADEEEEEEPEDSEEESEDSEGDEEEGDDEDGEGKQASLFDVAGMDPMGLSGSSGFKMTAAHEKLLDEIFSVKASSLPGAESAMTPRPRKKSTGVTSLGNMSRSASTRNSVSELEQLWKSEPDVSKIFGID